MVISFYRRDDMRGITHILNDKLGIYETYLYIAYIEDRIRMPEKNVCFD